MLSIVQFVTLILVEDLFVYAQAGCSGARLCNWLPWLPWSECSRTCGGGIRQRVRSICCKEVWIVADTCIPNCGQNKDYLFDTQVCNTQCFNNGLINSNNTCTCNDYAYGTCCEKHMASVTSFVVRGIGNSSSVTVNKKDNVSFACNVESNINSTIEIKFRDHIIKRQNDADSAYFDIDAASCQDAGIYTCRTWSQHNSGKYSVKELLLYVRCSPRPLKLPVANVAGAIGDTATFHYMGVPYPDLSFIWEKEEQNVWKRLSNSSYILISVAGADTVLNIRNVSLESYGIYKLTVINDIGEFIQHFHLNTENEQHKSEHGREGVIVGGVMGGVFICVVIVIAGIFYYRKYGFTCEGPKKDIPERNNKRGRGQLQNDMDTNQARYVDITNVYDRIVEETDAASLNSRQETYLKLGAMDENGDKYTDSIYANLQDQPITEENENIYVNLDGGSF